MLLIPYKSVYDLAADLNGSDSRREGLESADRPSRIARLVSFTRALSSRIGSRSPEETTSPRPRLGDVTH